MPRNPTATLAMIAAIAIAVMPLHATGAEPPGVTRTRAEIQIALCAPAERIVRALKLRPSGASTQTWLFDDAALILFERGLRLRLRVAEGRSELTLKVANQDCARLDPKAVPPAEGKCEYDIHGTRLAGAVSLTRRLGAGDSGELVAGRIAPAQLLSPSQVNYLRDVVAIWPLPPDIRALGPVQVRSYRGGSKPYDIDIAQLPTGETYVEISRKVPVADAMHAMVEMKADMSKAGVEMCADQSAQAGNKLRALLR